MGGTTSSARKHLPTFLQGGTTDDAKVKVFTQQLEGVLDVFETILATRPYLAGEQNRSCVCSGVVQQEMKGVLGTSESALSTWSIWLVSLSRVAWVQQIYGGEFCLRKRCGWVQQLLSCPRRVFDNPPVC